MSDDARLGRLVPDWTPPPRPEGLQLAGRYAALAPLSADDHAADLFELFAGADAVWDYMPVGPFSSAATFHRWMKEAVEGSDPCFFAIRNLDTGRWEGFCSLLRIAPEAGSIEVGYIAYSPALQRTRAATEAQFLLMQWAFEAGYRRYEWKCNNLNTGSKQAAVRLGFSLEGVFRQAAVVKGRNRDTAWFSVLDSEWPARRDAFERWLDPANFDSAGRQRASLAALREAPQDSP